MNVSEQITTKLSADLGYALQVSHIQELDNGGEDCPVCQTEGCQIQAQAYVTTMSGDDMFIEAGSADCLARAFESNVVDPDTLIIVEIENYTPVEIEDIEPAPSRYCLMVSQTTAKTCKHKAKWWVSYFMTYGPAAKATCDQHLAAAIRFVRRQAGGGVGKEMPKVFGLD